MAKPGPKPGFRAKKLEEEGTKYQLNNKLHIPDNPIKYELRKIQTLIRVFEWKMGKSLDTDFNIKGYIDLLARHTELQNKLVKDDDEKKRMAKLSKREAQRVGESDPASVDNGVSADNPLA